MADRLDPLGIEAGGEAFTRLSNVIGSPHNSASVRGWGEIALRRAIANCRRALDGLQPLHLVGDDERGAL
jgi:phosphoglycerate dehydrogenase-like enzyme